MTHYSHGFWQPLCITMLIILGGLFVAIQPAHAVEPPILYVFWGDGCPHCEKEQKFLEELQARYPELEMRWFEIWTQRDFLKLADNVREAYNIKAASVPMTFLGEWSTVGYLSDATTGIEIEEQVVRCLENGCPDALERVSKEPIVQRIRAEAAENNPINWQHFPSTAQSQEN